MKLKAFKEAIDKFYAEYGNIEVTVDLTSNEDGDETFWVTEDGYICSENIQDVTEVKDYRGNEVVGICLSNYIMEDNNWGKDD